MIICADDIELSFLVRKTVVRLAIISFEVLVTIELGFNLCEYNKLEFTFVPIEKLSLELALTFINRSFFIRYLWI